MVWTSTTVTLNSFWTASRIWILFASLATSKITWLCERSRLDFSVRMMGRLRMLSGTMMTPG